MRRGRGHSKVEQEGLVRRVSEQKGIPIIYLPKSLLGLGLKLAQEITIDMTTGDNPFAWEIRIKPTKKEEEQPIGA